MSGVLLQNVKLRRQVQRDQQCFVRQQELHLRVFISTKGGGQARTTFTSCQNAACFFLRWVDYALEGSTFSLSKCDFSRLFHTERSWHTYRFTVAFVSGQQDLLSDARAISLLSFEA